MRWLSALIRRAAAASRYVTGVHPSAIRVHSSAAVASRCVIVPHPSALRVRLWLPRPAFGFRVRLSAFSIRPSAFGSHASPTGSAIWRDSAPPKRVAVSRRGIASCQPDIAVRRGFPQSAKPATRLSRRLRNEKAPHRNRPEHDTIASPDSGSLPRDAASRRPDSLDKGEA